MNGLEKTVISAVTEINDKIKPISTIASVVINKIINPANNNRRIDIGDFPNIKAIIYETVIMYARCVDKCAPDKNK